MTAAVLVAADGDSPDIPGQPYVSPDDLASIGPLWQQAVQQQLVPVVAEVYQTSAGVVHAQMVDATQVPTLPSVGSLAAEQYLAAATNTFEQVGDDLWATARSELLDGFEKGESIDQLASRLRASAGMTAKKATLVARTQVLDASNAGSIATARATGIEMNKGWLDTGPPRTRPTHLQAGVTYGSDAGMIPLADQFTVGGYQCDRPHDPTLPPAEKYNCRCSVIFGIPDDSVDDAVDAAKPVAPIPGTSGIVEPVPVSADVVEDRIRSAYQELPKAPGGFVSLTDLRPALGDLSREDIDAALLRLGRQPGVSLEPFDMGFRITDFQPLRAEDYAAALHIAGGTDINMIAIRQAFALPGPDLGIPTVPGAGLTVRPALQSARTTTSVGRVFATEYRRITGRDIDPNSLYFEGSVATARQHAEGVLRGMERFPDVPLERVVAFGTGNEYASATSRAIRFNQVWTSPGDRKKYLDALAQDEASRWHVPGSGNPTAVALHEFGHVLDTSSDVFKRDLDGLLARTAAARDADLATARAAGELVDAEDFAAGGGVDGLIRRQVSRYGTKNREELVAEAFTDVMINGDRASDLSRDIFTLLEAEYRRGGGAVRTAGPEAALPSLPSPTAGLASRTVPQLRALAKERGITIPAGSKKPDIVRLLDEAPAPPTVAAEAVAGRAALDSIPVHVSTRTLGGLTDDIRGLDRLTARQQQAISDVVDAYRGLGYQGVNAYLRSGEQVRGAKTIVAGVDRAMDLSPLPTPIRLYRGVGSGEETFGPRAGWPADLTGFEWTDLGYPSTSVSREIVARGGGPIHLRFVAPQGTKAIKLSEFEQEVLLQRGLRFRVVRDNGPEDFVDGFGKTFHLDRVLDVEIIPTPAVAVPAVEVPLAKRTVAQLRALAAERKITVPKGAKKPDIVRLLEAPAAAPVVRPVPAEFAARLQSARKSRSAMAQTEYRFSGNAQENADMFPDPDERRQVMDAFAGYRGIGSARTNKQLRDGGFVGPRVELMDRAFARSHLQDDILVYRGSRGGIEFGPQESWAADLTGREWTDRAYTSTSYDPTKARPFAADGVYMRIVAPRGTPAVGLRPAARIEAGEAEILLGRGQTFRVVQDHGPTRPAGFDLPPDPDRPPPLRFLDVEVVPVDPAAERAAARALARETNALIEQSSATARVLAEVDELLAKKASASTIREAIADALVEPGQLFAGADPAVLAALRAVASDPVKLRAAVTRLGGKAKIKPLAKAGAKVTFDADTMEGVGGIDIPAGARVTVVRRGSTVTLPDGTVMQLEKARVTPVAAPVKATPEARLRVLFDQEPTDTRRLGGDSAYTNLVTYPDGQRAIEKVYGVRVKMPASEVKHELDAEELAPLVLRALGIRAPSVVRQGNRLLMEEIDGQVGADIWDIDLVEKAMKSKEGRLLGLADVLMANTDRNMGNWILLPGGRRIAGIDHGGAFQPGWTFDGNYPTDLTTFDDEFNIVPAATNLLNPADLAIIRERLEALRPAFVQLGRLKWYNEMMGRLAVLTERARGKRRTL